MKTYIYVHFHKCIYGSVHICIALSPKTLQCAQEKAQGGDIFSASETIFCVHTCSKTVVTKEFFSVTITNSRGEGGGLGSVTVKWRYQLGAGGG